MECISAGDKKYSVLINLVEKEKFLDMNKLINLVQNASAALLYSLVETAKLNKLDPHKYMHYLLEKIPVIDKEDFKELLPTQFKPEQIDIFLAAIQTAPQGMVC